MQYRPHIDGLRTVAVMSVVLFHADVSWLSGGFTGVDIFFVISGFLITSLIVKELEEGRFSLLSFYKRRALRILPAYLAMIAVVVVASWFLLFPEESRALGRSIVAASLFVSNIYFWRTSGYFDPAVETAPLLHTWTLSVEEQFYILLPLFLILVAGWFARRFALAILAVSAASFAISIWGVQFRGEATFYLLPTRIWEFGVGALAAVTALGARPVGGQGLRLGLALTGIGLILWSMLMLNGEMRFPGPNALYPVFGAVLLIAFAEGNAVGRGLSTGPMVYIGKISYSLYLWHWPVIVFWKMYLAPELGLADMIAVVALSALLAAFSYHYIEQPFRRPGLRRKSGLKINIVGAGALAASALAGLALATMADRWGNTPADLQRLASYYNYGGRVENLHPCFISARVPGRDKAYDAEACLAEDPERPTLLVLGDSHAEHLLHGLERALPGVQLQAATATGCRPLVTLERDGYCKRVIDRALKDHVPSGGVNTVLLSARWGDGDVAGLEATAAYLLDHVDEVIILGPTPEYSDSSAILMARTLRWGHRELDDFLDPEFRRLDDRMRAADFGTARYVSLYDLICPEKCRQLTADGVPLIYDTSHYTRSGGNELVRDLIDAGALPPPAGVRKDASL